MLPWPGHRVLPCTAVWMRPLGGLDTRHANTNTHTHTHTHTRSTPASPLANAQVSDLVKEMENGRLLRLMIKLGFINERPEGDAVR